MLSPQVIVNQVGGTPEFASLNLLIFGYFIMVVLIFGPIISKEGWIRLIFSLLIAMGVTNSLPQLKTFTEFVEDFNNLFGLGVIFAFWVIMFGVFFTFANYTLFKHVAKVSDDNGTITERFIFSLSFAGLFVSAFFRFVSPQLRNLVQAGTDGIWNTLVISDVGFFAWILFPFILLLLFTKKA
jgi:hypothetical protein